MAGDRKGKGKGKAVEKPKKNRTRECEWERALSVLDTQGQTQRSLCIRDRSAIAQGEADTAWADSATVAAQGTPPQSRSGRTRAKAPPPRSGP